MYANPSCSAADGIPYVVVVQGEMPDALATPSTIPLAMLDAAVKVPASLGPVISVKGRRLVRLDSEGRYPGTETKAYSVVISDLSGLSGMNDDVNIRVAACMALRRDQSDHSSARPQGNLRVCSQGRWLSSRRGQGLGDSRSNEKKPGESVTLRLARTNGKTCAVDLVAAPLKP